MLLAGTEEPHKHGKALGIDACLSAVIDAAGEVAETGGAAVILTGRGRKRPAVDALVHDLADIYERHTGKRAACHVDHYTLRDKGPATSFIKALIDKIAEGESLTSDAISQRLKGR